jgi:hypothetical protein
MLRAVLVRQPLALEKRSVPVQRPAQGVPPPETGLELVLPPLPSHSLSWSSASSSVCAALLLLPACSLGALQSILEQDALHAGFRSEVLKSQELQVRHAMRLACPGMQPLVAQRGKWHAALCFAAFRTALCLCLLSLGHCCVPATSRPPRFRCICTGGHIHSRHRAAADQPGEDPIRDPVGSLCCAVPCCAVLSCAVEIEVACSRCLRTLCQPWLVPLPRMCD